MIEKLLTMQKLDYELDQIREGAEVYPSRLAQVQADYDQKKKLLDTSKLQVETLEKERGTLQETLKLEEIRLKKSKMRINEIKTNYEYQAMRREIETTERTNAELEEQITKKGTDAEEIKKKIEQYDVDFQAAEKILAEVSAEVSTKTGEYEGVLKAKESEQKAIESELDRSLLSKYRLIRQRKHKDALVEVVQGACQGCFMNVPPQMGNEILRGGGIFQCPNCQRLLYAVSTKSA